jgi:hypothetical protein
MAGEFIGWMSDGQTAFNPPAFAVWIQWEESITLLLVFCGSFDGSEFL